MAYQGRVTGTSPPRARARRMTSPAAVTVLAALADAPPDGWTLVELGAATGVSSNYLADLLSTAVAEGLVESRPVQVRGRGRRPLAYRLTGGVDVLPAGVPDPGRPFVVDTPPL